MNGRIFNSENYISRNKKSGFEGWYFKISLDGAIFSFIVGVCKNNTDPHSFIQYIDSKRSCYYKFGLDEFSYHKEYMTVRIGKNTFSLKGINAEISDKCGDILCDIKFESPQLFKKSLYSPSAMGPFSYLPLPCSHAIIALNIKVSGNLTISGKLFSGEGNGYIEKDYGKTFPENYVWCHAQTPAYDEKAVSVVFALAYPLIFGIKGFICVFSLGGRQYKLSLYDFAKLKTVMKDNSFFFSLRKRGCRIRAKVNFDAADFHVLKAPEKSGMDCCVYETVSAVLELEYETKEGKGCISIPAAFESRGEFEC